MAITTAIPNAAKKHFIAGDIDFDANTIKVMLLNNTHTTNIDTQEYIDDVSTNEISGTGYTAGGATLGTKTVTQDNTNDLAYADAANTQWDGADFTAYYAVVYRDTGTPGTSPIIMIVDLDGAETVPEDGTFEIAWNASGIFKIS